MYSILKDNQNFINRYNILGMKSISRDGAFAWKKSLQVEPKENKIF